MLRKFSLKIKLAIGICSILAIYLFSIQISLILNILTLSYPLLIFDFTCLTAFIITTVAVFREINMIQKLDQMKKSTLESLINQSSLVSRADAKGKITYVNDIFCKVSGYKKHELLGKDHSVLNSRKHSKDFWNQMYTSAVKHKTTWNEAVTNKRKDGSEYIVDSWIIAEFDEKGNHIGYISTRHDLTDFYLSLDEIKNKESELSAIMKGINESSATIEFCTNGFIISANKKFLELSGYENIHEISGKHHSIFMNPLEVNSKNYDKFWQDLKNGKPKSGEFQKIKKDGTLFWISCTYNPVIDVTGKIVKILKIANDITESLSQKIELERKNAYLEHAAKILRHDMHSGINTYIPRGISSLERRISKFAKSNGLDDENIEKIFGTPMKLIKEGLHHSQKVYAGVKEFTNLVKKDSELEKLEVDLKYILKDYLKSTAYSSQVDIQELGKANVNPSLFCTAVDNLIRNGLKYNDSESKLIKVYKKNSNIIIEDNGRGMTQQEFEEYSKPYARKNNNLELGSGLGLGISIAIIKEHGWKLEILKSRKGTKLQIALDK